MPRTNNPPKYRRQPLRNLAFVQISGKRIYLGKHGSEKSLKKYGQIIEALAIDRANQAKAKPEEAQPAETTANAIEAVLSVGRAHSICEVVAAYMRHARTYYRKPTPFPKNEEERDFGRITSEFAGIKEAVRPLLKEFGDSVAENFGPLAFKKVIEALIKHSYKKQKKGKLKKYARKSINTHIGRLKRMFRWLASEERIPTHVWQAISTVESLHKHRTAAREPAKIRPVSQEHVDAIHGRVTRQIWAMVQVQRLTAMRPGEVVVMRTCDIDQAKKKWIYTPATHKTEHHDIDRTIQIGPKAQEILKEWLRPNDPEKFLFSPSDSIRDYNAALRAARKTKVQPTQQNRRLAAPRIRPGERYSESSYSRAIRRACRAAGIDHWFPNQLRHSAATEIRKIFGLDAAQAVLGHQNANVTQIYAEKNEAAARKVMGKIG